MINNADELSKLMVEIRTDINRQRAAQANAKRQVQDYQLAMPLNFCAGGNGLPYLGAGWSDPETEFTWSDGPASAIAARLPYTPDLLLIELSYAPLTTPTLPEQQVQLYIDSIEIAQWQARTFGTYRGVFTMPASSGIINLSFHFPNATSPDSLGLGPDLRCLGIALRQLVIKTV